MKPNLCIKDEQFNVNKSKLYIETQKDFVILKTKTIQIATLF